MQFDSILDDLVKAFDKLAVGMQEDKFSSIWLSLKIPL